MFQKNCYCCEKEFSARRSIDIYCSLDCRELGTAEKNRRSAAEWCKANLERARENNALYRKANADKVGKPIKAWHLANPEKHTEHRAKWRKEHAEEIKKSKASSRFSVCFCQRSAAEQTKV